jgi:hypothetical protein
VFADVVDLHDVRVLQGRPGSGLAQKPLALARAGQGAGAQQLQRHRPAEPPVPRPVHDAHAAAADFFQDIVAGDDRRRPLWARRRRRQFIAAGWRIGVG